MKLEEKKLTIDDHEICYYTTNDKNDTTYYFLGGWGIPSTIFDMYTLADKIKDETCNIVIIERFGQGKSEQTDKVRNFNNILEEINHIVKNEKSNRNILIGHSSGGLYAFEYAKKFNEIDEIILLDAVPMTGNISRKFYNINYIYAYVFILLRKCNLFKNLSVLTLSNIEKINKIDIIPEIYQDNAVEFCKNKIYNTNVRNELKYLKKDITKVYSDVEKLKNIKITSIVRKQTYSLGLKMKDELERNNVEMNLINLGKSSHYVHNEFPDMIRKIISN